MIIESIKCARCNRAEEITDTTNISSWFSVTMNGVFKAERLDALNYRETQSHYCGQECVSRTFQEWLDSPQVK